MNFETAVPVGKGATGEVAKAWDPSLNRWVALKFLRHDTPEAEERMLREARAQAMIDHPNVCKVFDIGERDGRRFIAMQYIDGQPLDEALRELDVDAKIGLMKTIAEAVQAAHSAGLIHRDLKPSNILVETTDDGQFKPYVVDFGIARELDVAGSTMTGQVIGTPGYLSPEQARGEVTTLDRRSDVFSLGVILYELLADVRPHGGTSEADVLVNLLREDPVPLRKKAPNISEDLETIVMTCLEKDREKRYPSARALADDLGRFLAGEPIEARPTTRLDRLRRRVKRSPVVATLLGFATLAIFALVVALAASWVQYTKDLEREREAALAAKTQAELKESEAKEVADFLAGLFEVADTGSTHGKTITARELLERGAGNVERDLADQPIVQARMMAVIADVHANLGLRDEAATLALKSLELRRETPGTDPLLIAESHVILAEVYNKHRNPKDAVEHYLAAAEIQKEILGPESPELAFTRSELASALIGIREIDEAEKNVEAALRVLLPALGPDDSRVLGARVTQATVLRARQDYKGAADIYEDVLARQRRSLGNNHLQVSVTLNNLAYMLRALGEPGRAATLYREALAIHEAAYPEPHPDQIQIMQNLSSALYLSGQEADSTDVLRHVVDLSRILYPKGHWRIGSALASGVARSLAMRGLCEEAVPAYQEGVGIWRAGLGDDHPWTAKGEGEYATCLAALGRLKEARALVDRSVNSLRSRTDLTPGDWQDMERIADRFDSVGQPRLAQRYRDIMTDDLKPVGLTQIPPRK